VGAQEGDKFSLALAKTVNLDNTPTDGTFNAVSVQPAASHAWTLSQIMGGIMNYQGWQRYQREASQAHQESMLECRTVW